MHPETHWIVHDLWSEDRLRAFDSNDALAYSKRDWIALEGCIERAELAVVLRQHPAASDWLVATQVFARLYARSKCWGPSPMYSWPGSVDLAPDGRTELDQSHLKDLPREARWYELWQVLIALRLATPGATPFDESDHRRTGNEG